MNTKIKETGQAQGPDYNKKTDDEFSQTWRFRQRARPKTEPHDCEIGDASR